MKQCFECEPGFFLQKGRCIAIPKCVEITKSTNSYVFFQDTGFNEFLPHCGICPDGCMGCEPNDPYNLLDGFSCQNCAQGYAFNSFGQCVEEWQLKTIVCTKGKKAYANAQKVLECGSCGTNCNDCYGFFNGASFEVTDCVECAPNFYEFFDETMKRIKCSPIPSCPAN